jgi:hypothetical protein
MEWILFLAIMIVAAFLVLKLKGLQQREATPEALPYESQATLFTPAERSFYGVLVQAVGDRAVVFGKVRVADVLTPKKGLERKAWHSAFNRISAKHFDYVLCKPDTLAVMSVIELDDSSHARKKRVERDQFIERACAAAGVTLHRFRAASSYTIGAVREVVLPIADADMPEPEAVTVTAATETLSVAPAPSVVSAPEAVEGESVAEESKETVAPAPQIAEAEKPHICPKCSSAMVKRVAKKGAHKGTEFIACSAFPKCRYVVKAVV